MNLFILFKYKLEINSILALNDIQMVLLNVNSNQETTFNEQHSIDWTQTKLKSKANLNTCSKSQIHLNLI